MKLTNRQIRYWAWAKLPRFVLEAVCSRRYLVLSRYMSRIKSAVHKHKRFILIGDNKVFTARTKKEVLEKASRLHGPVHCLIQVKQ